MSPSPPKPRRSFRSPEVELATKFDERFRRGDVCLAAIDADGGTAHTRWLMTPTPIPELDMEISLMPRTAYFYHGHTRSDVRGRGIDGTVRCTIFGMLRKSGFERVYSYVQGENPAGIRAAKRWQRCVGRAWYLRFRGFRRFVVRRGETRRLLTRLPKPADQRERALRAHAWRKWFEGRP